jgi:hypothetical protein
MMIRSTFFPIKDRTKQFDTLLTLLSDLLKSSQCPLIIRLDCHYDRETRLGIGEYTDVWKGMIIKALDSIRLIDHVQCDRTMDIPNHSPFDHQQLVSQRRVTLHQMLDPCLAFIWGVVDLSLDYERSLHHEMTYSGYRSPYKPMSVVADDHRVIWLQGNDFADRTKEMEDHHALLCRPMTNNQCISYIQQTHSTCTWHDKLFPTTREIDLVIEQVQLVSQFPHQCTTCKSYHFNEKEEESEQEIQGATTLVPFRLTSRLHPTTPITMLVSYSLASAGGCPSNNSN